MFRSLPHWITAGCLAMLAAPSGAETWGRVYDPATRRGVSGVEVALVSGAHTHTDSAGEWRLGSAAVLERGSARGPASTARLGAHLQVVLAGRDGLGRAVASDAPAPPVAKRVLAAADTLVYSYQGRVFLRDTIGGGQEMVRAFDTTTNPAIVHGYLYDSRDASWYRTVRLGDQEWMAQNLALDSLSWCYDDAPSCPQGRLYSWATAMARPDSCDLSPCMEGDFVVQGICPVGWHLPLKSEWLHLRSWMMAQSGLDSGHVGELFKSTQGWSDDLHADRFGFHAQALGDRYFEGSFYDEGDYAVFWSASPFDATGAWHIFPTSNDSRLHFHSGCDKRDGFSVRCVRDRPLGW